MILYLFINYSYNTYDNFRYCECFQGGVVCSERCRCLECRNFTGSSYRLDAIQRLQSKERPEGDPKLIENPYDNDRNNIGNEDSLLKDVHLQKNSTIGSSVYRNNTLIWVFKKQIYFPFLIFLFY